MAYDEKLAERIRKRLGKRAGLTEKKMFGGIGFMLNGNMCCGGHGQEMIVRIDPEKTDQTLGEQRCRACKVGARRRGLRCYVAWKEVAGDLSSSSMRARCHQSMAMPGSATRKVKKKNAVQPKLSASAPAAGPT